MIISKLSSVTVGFLVKNGFGVSWKGCRRNFKRFWSLDQGRSYYLKNLRVVQSELLMGRWIDPLLPYLPFIGVPKDLTRGFILSWTTLTRLFTCNKVIAYHRPHLVYEWPLNLFILLVSVLMDVRTCLLFVTRWFKFKVKYWNDG